VKPRRPSSWARSPHGHRRDESSPICPAGPSNRIRWLILALGIRLRAYAFDRYQTKRKDEEEHAKEVRGDDCGRDARWRRKSRSAPRDASPMAWCSRGDLVNEPSNVLHPEEFAAFARET